MGRLFLHLALGLACLAECAAARDFSNSLWWLSGLVGAMACCVLFLDTAIRLSNLAATEDAEGESDQL